MPHRSRPRCSSPGPTRSPGATSSASRKHATCAARRSRCCSGIFARTRRACSAAAPPRSCGSATTPKPGQAAAYIGRRHTFVVSSYTATRGGWSQSGGAYWSDTETRQRGYEYAVEPTALQNLPDCALLLADRDGGSLRLHAVECDPAIITLAGASTAPLPQPASLSYGGMRPAVADAMNPAGPAIDASGQYPAEWQDPSAEEPEPAWPPDEQPPDPPWWEQTQPPR